MDKAKPRILVVDDEETIRKLLQTRFSREDWEVETAGDGKEGLDRALSELRQPGAFHVVVTDIKMPGLDGFQLIEALHEGRFESPIIMITGHGEKECAIEAIHKGAFDYLEKPFNLDEIVQTVQRAIEHENLRRANIKLIDQLASQLEVKSELLERATHHEEDDLLVGKSSYIQNVKDMVAAVASSFTGENDPVVLVHGESGVGKEVVARYVHQKVFGKNDNSKPFVAINCAAFPDHLLESELFGYEKGAFTGAAGRKLGLFELANRGTLFMDEIGEMDIKMQAKLLRVLQERTIRRVGGTSDIKVNAHIVAATNRDLTKAVAEGRFREDLFYRLNTIPLTIPPLRSRTEDIPVLAEFFLRTLSKSRGKKFSGFSPAAMKSMMQYRWPGNVRELKSVIERAIILEKGPQLELSQLRQENLRSGGLREAAGDTHVAEIGPNGTSPVTSITPASSGTLGPSGPRLYSAVTERGLARVRDQVDEELTRDVLIHWLNTTSGNVSAVSRDLKLDRANLLRLLRRFEIDPDLFRQQKKAS